MLRNVCLNLIHLRLPNDVLSEYSRLASMLLKIVEQEEDEFVQKLGLSTIYPNLLLYHYLFFSRNRNLSIEFSSLPN